jgi:hypothetical protein
MAKVSAVMLALILAAILGVGVVGRTASRPETVYTVPHVLASLPALRGRTVRVRGFLGFPLSFGWPPIPRTRPCPTCGPKLYAINGDVVHHGTSYWTPFLLVTPGHEDAILALLRQAQLLEPCLPSFPAMPGRPGTYRVQIGQPAGYACVGREPCPAGVLLDTPY